MANAIGVTSSVIDGTTLTVVFGVTGDTAIDGANFVVEFSDAGVTGVSLVDPGSIPFGLWESNDVPLGRFAFAGLGSTLPSGTTIFTLEIEFSSPPSPLSIHVSGESSAGDLTAVDVLLDDGSFNTEPFGDVTITGTPTEGEELSVSNTIDDFDGNGAVSYQWQADGLDIVGATSATLVLGQDQVGAVITVEARYTDGEGNNEVVESDPTTAVVGVNDNPVAVADTVDATEDVDVTFDATALLENDSDPDDDPLSISSVSAVTGGSVVLDGGDVVFSPAEDFNGEASFTYIASDGNGGFSEAATVTVNVAPSNDGPTGTVAITGTALEGEILSVSNTLADADGLGEIAYQWQADGVDIDGATESSLALGVDHVGKVITVVASYTDDDGTDESVSSLPTGAVSQLNQPPVGGVLITGQLAIGETLQAIPDFTDLDGITSEYSYQWYRSGAQIDGAIGQNYQLTADDIDQQLRVRVRYTDELGKLESVYSQSVLVDVDNSVPTGSPVIDGEAVEGQLLMVDASTIADLDGLGDFSYQWLRDEVAVDGATSTSYLLSLDDIGSSISVRVSYTDGGGAEEQLFSAGTTEVAEWLGVNNPATGLAAVFGDGEPGQVLEINGGSIADADGLGAFSYQWYVDGEAVEGETSTSFLLNENDIGKQVYAILSYTDGMGFAEVVETEVRLVTDPLSDSFADLIRVYITVLGRAPANEGLTFWSDQINSGSTFEEVASAMWGSSGAQEAYPPELTTEEKVTAFYENILNRSPAESGLTFWSNSWDRVGPVDTMLEMIGALSANNSDDPQAIADKVLFQAKVDIGGYLAVTLGSNDIDLAADAYQYLDSGNSVEDTVDYIGERIGDIENHSPTGIVAIIGDGEPGALLEVNADSIEDEDGLGSFSYQWFVDGEVLEGETSNIFMLTEADVGKQVYATLAYTDGAGFNELLETEIRLVTDPLSESFAELIKVYITVLGRAPARDGLEFWSDQINAGETFEEVAAAMWSSDGAQEVYPPELSTEDKVTAFFENILNRSPAESGLEFWSESWNSLGPVETMLNMIDALSSNNSDVPQAIADKGLFQAKVDIGGYLAVTLGSNDLELAANAYQYLDDGNSVGITVDYIDQQVDIIGVSPAELLI